jgi:DNA invertase Pin-like site-specific DNA recombinase
LSGFSSGRSLPWAATCATVITTVYELADLGITIVPLKSQTGPVNRAMGRLLWAIQGWYAEMENEERSENVKTGQAPAQGAGQGNRSPPWGIGEATAEQIARLRALGHGYKAIAQATGVSRTTVRRILKISELKAA